MKVSVQYAAEHFEDLVSAVYNGDEVEIEQVGQPALRLVVKPLRASLANAPWEDEEISDEENEAVAKAKAENNPGTSMADFMAELGITQEDLDHVGEKDLQEQSSVGRA